MKNKPITLFLALNVFDSTGGVQRVCRTMTYLLSGLFGKDRRVYSMYDGESDAKYISGQAFRGYQGSATAFTLNAFVRGMQSNTIIISHIHLVAVVALIRLFNHEVKLILFAHGTEVWRDFPGWKKWFLRKYAEIWAVSEHTRQVLKTKHQLSKNVRVVHNCLDPFFKLPNTFKRPAYLLKRYRLSENQPVLLTVCRMESYEREKGYNLIIEMMPKLLEEFPDLHYLLCGQAGENELRRLHQLIRKHKLEAHISLTGPIAEDELADHYRLASSFVLPSTKEGFGMVLIEAAACGCQVISGNAGGCPEAALQGQLADLVDPLSPKDLYLVISKQLRKDRSDSDKKTNKISVPNTLDISDIKKKSKTC